MVETKVKASTAAAAVSGLALWALGHYVFKTGVPDVVASWVYVLVPGVITFAAGYLSKHTNRLPPPVITLPGGTDAGKQIFEALKLASRTAAPTVQDVPPVQPPAGPTSG